MPGRTVCRRGLPACLLALLAAGLLGAGPAQAAASLDDRGWEMVSPVGKNGGQVAAPGSLWGGGLIQAAAGGGAATFGSAASFGEGAAGAPWASQYLSRRAAGGWVTRDTTPPTLSGAYGAEPDGVPYQLFSGDLSRALMLDGRRCAAGPCPRSYSLRSGEGALLADSPRARGLGLAGATPDLSHVVLGDEGGLWEWDGGAPLAISAQPGAALGARSGAISADGSRVYWVDEAGGLHLWEAGVEEPVDESGHTSFQVASADGSLAFYTVEEHLYRYAVATHAATDLTPAGGVKGVLGASADGDVVYYQGAAGLYRWEEGTTTEVAPGAEAAAPGDWPPATGTARLTADGQILAFLSREPLTHYDNVDPRTGDADAELFRWQAGVGLACVSCDPSGARPRGPVAIPGAEPGGHRPRALAADGRRLFFESPDALVPGDANGTTDVYEWEAAGEGTCARAGGCLGLISSGLAAGGATFADASASGADAFFLTGASLVGADPGALDLYDAREGGGFPEPATEPPCEADACQAIPPEPVDVQPGTLQGGPGNPPLGHPAPRCPKGKRRVGRRGHVRCVARYHGPVRHRGRGHHHRHEHKRGRR